MQHLTITISFMAFALTACNAENTQKQTTATAQTQTTTTTQTTEANAPKTEGIWIDVREADEYAQGHLQSAVNITGRDLPSRIGAIAPDKNTPINLYCRSGNRSEQARKILMDMGYTNVINQGGYQALYEKGYR